jgi:hypothetical protein
MQPTKLLPSGVFLAPIGTPYSISLASDRTTSRVHHPIFDSGGCMTSSWYKRLNQYSPSSEIYACSSRLQLRLGYPIGAVSDVLKMMRKLLKSLICSSTTFCEQAPRFCLSHGGTFTKFIRSTIKLNRSYRDITVCKGAFVRD